MLKVLKNTTEKQVTVCRDGQSETMGREAAEALPADRVLDLRVYPPE